MSIAVIVGVHDGVVLAADSASTLTVGVPLPQGQQIVAGVLNVYDNANKIFNLHKGSPLGCITFGSGSIGNASIATLIKDLREELTKKQLGFDPDSYTMVQVSEILAEFLGKECSKVAEPTIRQSINMGFLLGGYSIKKGLKESESESWSVEIKGGVPSDPVELRKKHDAGISWGGQGEILSRIVLGYSPALLQVLAQSMRGPKGPVSPEELLQTLGPALAGIQAPIVFPPMPIQDAIDLARFLVHSAVMFSRFAPGPQVVGGPIEIAAITKHEGFKWINRKHYYDQEFNKEPIHVISDR